MFEVEVQGDVRAAGELERVFAGVEIFGAVMEGVGAEEGLTDGEEVILGTDPFDADTDDETIPCPYCGELMHDESVRCPHCGNYVKKQEPQISALCCVCGWEEYKNSLQVSEEESATTARQDSPDTKGDFPTRDKF